ncbi:MAG: M60 family metallopeptidase, partial [Verrucomicrobia bacterium]|nr:M60 family metallopeptidase [Verrucomicrobiota bacterium]
MKNKFRSATKVSGLALLLAVLCLSSAHGQSITNPIAQLKSHILGTTILTAAQIVAQGNSIQAGITQVGTNAVALAAALNLVATFDASPNKPLFTSGSTTYGGFTRDGAGDELAQALFDLQQGILDYTYEPANLITYYTQLNNTKFATSTYFPGAVAPPANTNQGYAVPINASVLADWGSPAMYQTWGTRRPTGCYLAPGSIGYVTVPAALVNKGYSVRVGAHYWDLSAKTTVERLDRVSLVYPISSATTRIANPLGGGIYIEVPYKITNGIVTVGLTNVVRSPLFRSTSFDQTTAAEWLTERTQPGPWADFESDKFMMQVPRKWIYNYTNAVKVMQDWDSAMDAVSDLMGRNRIRSKTVLYLQVDVAYRGTANFPGYPQSNINYDMNTVETGNKNHYLLTGPQNSDYAVFHELGHAELFTKFTGEVEAVVNLNYVAVQNQKFGMSLETAFGRSMGGSANASVNLSQAALTWILTDSFRAGETMSQVRMQYQHRGYGKYVEIANLFGWGALSNFWHSVHVDYMNGIDYPENSDPTDSRMLRMSQAAGVDLRPLIHFWGVKPINAATLKTSIQNAGLPPSALIYNRLKYYQTVVPTNLTQFTAHHTAVANVVDGSVDGNWYTNMLVNFTPDIGYSTISKVQEIIDLYFPTGLPTGTLSNTPAAMLTTNSAALKAALGCNGNSFSVHAFWNPVNGTTNAALWTNSAYVGSWTNVAATNLSYTASGLVPGRVYYYTFRATNAYQTLWATNVLSFSIAPAFDWSGATSANMSGTPANWGGTVPTATDIARWNAATYVNAPTANANLTLGQLLFDAGNTSGVTFGPGAATLTLNGVVAGTGLQMNSGSGAVNTGGAQFALGADQKWSNNDNSLLTVGGAITNGGFLLTLDGVGAMSLNGVLSGAGGLAVANGTNTLSGANTYTGDTIISSGTLKLGASNVIPDGAANGDVTINGRLDLNTFSETINGLSGAGTVDTVAGGSPTLTLNINQASTFS